MSEGMLSFLHGDAKRSIVAVILFAFAALFTLGYFDAAGLLGGFLNTILGSLLGWGKWVFPVVLVVAGIFLLQRRQSSLAEFLKLAGITVAFASLLGFFHLYLDGDMKKAAQAGEGGGYVGFALAYTLEKFTGTVAGTIILVALFLTGLITAFNLSLIRFFERLQARLRREKGVDDEGGDEAEDDEVESMEEDEEQNVLSRSFGGGEMTGNVASVPEQSVAKSESTILEEQNIRNIEFVGDATRTVASKVQENEDDDEADDGVVDVGEIYRPTRRRPKKRRTAARRWELPSPDLLEASTGEATGGDVEQNAEIIQRTLKHFGIDVELGEIQTGPTVTQYTFRPAVGVKLSRITTLSNDLALALAAHPIRIEAPIPGKSLVGIEVPNHTTAMVRLKDILLHPVFARRDNSMTLVLGQDVSGNYAMADLRKMPHLLVAGATNSGKSVCINTLLLSLLYQNSPDDLKLILVDPKRVELSLYNKIPHLKTDVIVENKKVVNALRWAVSEMDRRYKLLQETGSRDVASYHEKFDRGETRVVKDDRTNESHEEDLEKLPYIVIVIDEMADLMMAHGKEVEGLIVRLAQMARAVGIHLILATQRPSVEVLTGLIKANVTTRIAFQVATQIDSRTILDQGGAEKLLGRGDMLYVSAGSNQPKRLQGVFISESEVKRVVDFLVRQKLEEGNEESLDDDIAGTDKKSSDSRSAAFDPESITSDNGAQEDDLYLEAKEVAIQAGKLSASLLQRRLRVGYARAARLLDLLENDGIIGPADGAKPREVYIGNNAPQAVSEEDEKDDDPVLEQEKRDKWQV